METETERLDSPGAPEVAGFRVALDAAVDGVSIQDVEGNILYLNPAARRNLGIDTAEARRLPPGGIAARFEIRTPDGAPLDPEQLPGRVAVREERPAGPVLLQYRPAGGSREERPWNWALVRAEPFRLRSGRLAGAVNVWTDTTSLHTAEQKLEFRTALLEAEMEASPEGVLVVSPEGRMLSYNRRFVEMWGIPQEVMSTKSDRAALEAVRGKLADPDAFYEAVDDLYRHPGADERREIELRDGRIFERVSRALQPCGRYRGRVWFFRDVTALKEAAAKEAALAEERAARRSAEEAIRAREEFLAVASHELRTPMAALLLAEQALARLIAETDLPRHLSASTLQLLHALETPTRQMAGIVDVLLDLARLQSEGLRIVPAEVDLVEVARAAVERARAENVRGPTEIRLSARQPVRGRWDARYLERVIGNLLSNAIKYGRGNPVDVRVERGTERAVIEVEDRGIGIAPERQGAIFSRFERAVPWQNFPGLGLGLYIVRRIVEAFGGEVRVRSEPGHGAVFRVEIPYDVDAGRIAAASEESDG